MVEHGGLAHPKVLCWQVLLCKVCSKRQGQNSKVPSVLEAYRALRQRRGPEAASGHGRAWRTGASEGPRLAGPGLQLASKLSCALRGQGFGHVMEICPIPIQRAKDPASV